MSSASKQKPEAKKQGRPKGSQARQFIIDNAGSAFVKHGFHACTVAHILEETGVSRTNFYRFFKSKEAVFESIYQQCLEKLASEMKVSRKYLSSATSAQDHFEKMFDAYLGACFSDDELLPIIIQESQTLPEYRALRDKMLKDFKGNFNRVLPEHGYQKPDPLVLEGFLAAVDRIMLLEAMKSGSSASKIKKVKKACLTFTTLLLVKEE